MLRWGGPMLHAKFGSRKARVASFRDFARGIPQAGKGAAAGHESCSRKRQLTIKKNSMLWRRFNGLLFDVGNV